MALTAVAFALGGCATSISEMPIANNNGPTPTSARASSDAGYLPVEDMPPGREEAAIAPDEQAKIKKELLAARDRQASAAGKDQSAK